MASTGSWSPAALVAAAAAVVAVAGCASLDNSNSGGSAGSELSRVKLYASVDELAADSPLIIEGTVASQSVAADIDPVTDFTLSVVTVQRTLQGDAATNTGTKIVVRQLGSTAQPPPVPLLTPGEVYLLYLTPTGLSGPLSSQYYVTGANAGIYVQEPPGQAGKSTAPLFNQVQREPGESLPAQLDESRAIG